MDKEQIKRIRKKLFLTQEEFGKILGISQTTITKWETGICEISARNSNKILELCRQNNISITTEEN